MRNGQRIRGNERTDFGGATTIVNALYSGDGVIYFPESVSVYHQQISIAVKVRGDI